MMIAAHRNATIDMGAACDCERVVQKSRLHSPEIHPLGKGPMFGHQHDPEDLLNYIVQNQDNIADRQERLMADVTALNAAVAENTTAVDAAVAKLSEAGVPTQTEVDTLTAAVQASVTALNAAVANVPA